MTENPNILTDQTEPSVDTPWMTPQEASAYLRFTVSTLAAWRGEGVGPRYARPTGGRGVRYHRDDLDRFLQAALV